MAERAAERLLDDRMQPEGYVIQASQTEAMSADERMRATHEASRSRRFLVTQAQLGLALLALYDATAEARWREAAQRLGDALLPLEDPQGGFFASDAPTIAGLGRHKPFLGNEARGAFGIEHRGGPASSSTSPSGAQRTS